MVGMNDRMNCNIGNLYDDNQQYYSHDDPATSGKTVISLLVNLPARMYVPSCNTAVAVYWSKHFCFSTQHFGTSCNVILFKSG